MTKLQRMLSKKLKKLKAGFAYKVDKILLTLRFDSLRHFNSQENTGTY